MADPIFIISLAVLLLHLSPLINVDGSPNLHKFMYKYCSTDKLDVDPNGMFTDTRQSLVQQLLPHSSQSNSYRTAFIPDQQVALWGHFQCRRDLIADDCHSCVDSFSNLSSNSWCANSLAARVQLYGCHIQYEADGSEIPGADLNHNGCGQESAGDGFEEAVRAALAALETGVMENPNGYCSVDVGGVYAVAQCAEGVSECDCGECVAKAAGVAAEECAGSLSGHAYLDMCFVSFEFRPGSNSNPVLVNNEPGPTFKPLCGLRQGNLIAPLIFIIAMEYLTRTLQCQTMQRSPKEKGEEEASGLQESWWQSRQEGLHSSFSPLFYLRNRSTRMMIIDHGLWCSGKYLSKTRRI